MVFDYGCTIFNHKCEIYGLETCYSQNAISRLCSSFQTMKQNMIDFLLLLILSVMGDEEISIFSVSRWNFLGVAEMILFSMA